MDINELKIIAKLRGFGVCESEDRNYVYIFTGVGKLSDELVMFDSNGNLLEIWIWVSKYMPSKYTNNDNLPKDCQLSFLWTSNEP